MNERKTAQCKICGHPENHHPFRHRFEAWEPTRPEVKIAAGSSEPTLEQANARIAKLHILLGKKETEWEERVKVLLDKISRLESQPVFPKTAQQVCSLANFLMIEFPGEADGTAVEVAMRLLLKFKDLEKRVGARKI